MPAADGLRVEQDMAFARAYTEQRIAGLAPVGSVLRAALLTVALGGALGSATTAQGKEEPLPVPSGLDVRFFEMLWDQPGDGLVYRFRFIAPAIGLQDGPDFDAVMDDMAWLCTNYALPRIASTGPQPNQIVISLSDKETEFGVMTEGATQFFEAYSVENDTCIWELF